MALKKKGAKKRPLKKKTVKRKPAKKTVKKAAKKRVVLKKAKKSAKKPAPKAGAALFKHKKDLLGTITHYFPKVRAAVIKLKAPLKIGDTIKIKGHTTDFTQTITSMQIDRVPISAAKPGQEIGLLVNSRVRQHDLVLKP